MRREFCRTRRSPTTLAPEIASSKPYIPYRVNERTRFSRSFDNRRRASSSDAIIIVVVATNRDFPYTHNYDSLSINFFFFFFFSLSFFTYLIRLFQMIFIRIDGTYITVFSFQMVVASKFTIRACTFAYYFGEQKKKEDM